MPHSSLRPLLPTDPEQEIFRCEDEWGPLVVSERGGFRQLTFGTPYEQSAFKLNAPYALAFDYTQAMLIPLALHSPRQVMLLGLGGGSLLRSLHHHFQPMDFHVIELRQRVIDIAREYFMAPDDARVRMTCTNAAQFLESLTEPCTDMIFSDLYEAWAMDRYQGTTRFLKHCHRALTHDGWLAINLHAMPRLDHPFLRTLCTLFPEVYWCSIDSGNHIVLCGKAELSDLSATLWPRVTALEGRLGERLSPFVRRLVKLERPENASLTLAMPFGCWMTP